MPYIVKGSISMAANLREILKDEETLSTIGITLKGKERPKALVMVDAQVMLAPIDDFREEEAEILYRHTFSRQGELHASAADDLVLHTVLPDLGVVAIFGVNKDLRLVCVDHFADVRFMPLAVPVWNSLFKRSVPGVRQKLYAYFHDRKMEVFCYGQRRFKFANAFQVNHAHDALYFLLYVWRQLGLDADNDEVQLLGDMPDLAWIDQRLRLYIDKVCIIQPTSLLGTDPVTRFRDMPLDLMMLMKR